MTRRTGRTRRAVVLAGLLAALALVAGCVRIPDTGPVRSLGDDVLGEPSSVRYQPPGPAAGASPADIVYGFLDAMLAFPVSVDVATEYLTPDAAESWRPDTATTVYGAPRVTAEAGVDVSTATLTTSIEAVLDRRGRFRGGVGEASTTTWRLERVGGQWRIADPPDGLLVDQRFFEANYQPVSLYFLDAPAARLVQDPVYLPSGESLPTALVSRLLLGPGGLLDGSARSALPSGTRLDGPVPIRRDGVAEVSLTGDAGELATRTRELLSAQLVRTLGQVPGIQGVRIDVGGVPLEVPGVARTQPISAWTELDPPGGRTVGQVFAIQGDSLVVVNGTSTDEFATALPRGASGVADFRIDPRLRRIAVVPASRDRIAAADLDEQPDLARPAYVGADVLKPVWDADGRLWAIDRTRQGTRLTIVDGRASRRVPLGVLSGLRVDAFELSPDNARFVASVRSDDGAPLVYVGSVVSDDSGTVTRLADLRVLPLADAGLTDVRSVAWRSPTSVVALAVAGSGAPQSYVARVDGSSVSGGSLTGDTLLGDVGAERVLASGDENAPIYVGDREQRLWLRDSAGRWQRVDSGSLRVPSYPG